jgi:hypothetical protein
LAGRTANAIGMWANNDGHGNNDVVSLSKHPASQHTASSCVLLVMPLQVRGPVIAAWSHHLDAVWSTKPYADEVHFSEANLKVYQGCVGVPDVFLQASAAPQTQAEAAKLQSMLTGNRSGYASTRYGSAEDAFAADGGINAAASSQGSEDSNPSMEHEIGSMTGIDDYEVQINTSPGIEQMQQLAAALQPTTAGDDSIAQTQQSNVQPLLTHGATLVSVSGRVNSTISDYKPHWPLLVHPGTFPHGEGGCPKGMSMAHWVRLLLSRHPHEQYAGNIPFCLHMFNVLQRHDVNCKTNISLVQAPRVLEQAGHATVADLDLVLTFLKAGGRALWLIASTHQLPQLPRPC